MNIPVYDRDTRMKLAWLHGDERANSIVNRTDAATNADIAAWRRLGGTPVKQSDAKAPPAHWGLDDKIMWYAAKGYEPADIAQRLSVQALMVSHILRLHA